MHFDSQFFQEYTREFCKTYEFSETMRYRSVNDRIQPETRKCNQMDIPTRYLEPPFYLFRDE